MANRVRHLLLLLAGMSLLISSALLAEEKPIIWSGCSVAKQAFMIGLAEAYQQRTGIKIRVSGSDSTTSIRDTIAGKNDIGGACRVTLDTDPLERKAHQIPVAWDALVVVVHKDNPLENISLAQLQRLYRGELTSWQTLNGQSAPIELYGGSDRFSDEALSLRELLYHNPAAALQISHQVESSRQILQATEDNVNAIGITGMSEALAHDVKILRVDNRLPSYENIRYGDYALTRPLFLITRYKNQDRQVQKFVRFAVSREGQDVIRKQGTVPYAEAMVLVMKQQQQSGRASAQDLFRNRASLN